MGIYARQIYKKFASKMEEMARERASIVVITIPGLGVSYFVGKYLEKTGKGEKRIVEEGQKLADFNFLDLDFDKRGAEEGLRLVDDYMKQADLKQKFVVVVNTPWLLKGKAYKSSYLASHVYDSWVMRVHDKKETIDFVDDLGIKLSDKEMKRLFELSGGISRLIKYLAVNKEELEMPINEIVESEDILRIFEKSLEVIGKTDDEWLVRMGIKNNQNEFVSELVGGLLKKRMKIKGVEIEVGRDMSVYEYGKRGKERLTGMEAVLLKALIADGDLLLTRDKIADLKWEGESYDKYSDQAIGKAMLRLGEKLKKHKLVAIPKLGYKLELK